MNDERIVTLEAELAKLKDARELSAIASATLRDESIAKSARIRALEAELVQAQARVIELSDMKPATLRQRVQELEAELEEEKKRSDGYAAIAGRQYQVLINAGLDPVASSAATPCRIYEHDGAFTCYAHTKRWGAITHPDPPCAGWSEAKTKVEYTGKYSDGTSRLEPTSDRGSKP